MGTQLSVWVAHYFLTLSRLFYKTLIGVLKYTVLWSIFTLEIFDFPKQIQLVQASTTNFVTQPETRKILIDKTFLYKNVFLHFFEIVMNLQLFNFVSVWSF